MKIIKFIIITFLVVWMFNPSSTNGENTSPITVQPELPANQVKNKRGYFHLKVRPGQTENLFINISNLSDEEQTVEIYAVDAYTRPTGGILYEEKMETEASNLLDPNLALSNFVNVPESIRIPAGETERVPITIELQEDITSGTLLGAIRVAALTGEEQQVKTDDANVTVKNRVSFTTAIQLDFPEESKPNFSLGEVNVRTQIPQTDLIIEMFNKSQSILGETTITYQVLLGEEEVFSGDIGEFTMVPNTSILYPIEWEKQDLESGIYTVNLTANVSGQEIQEQRSFKVDREQTKDHKEIEELEQDESAYDIPWWVWVFGGLAVLILFLLAFFLGRRTK